MAGCITQDYKELLKVLIERKIDLNALSTVVDIIPLCSEVRGGVPHDVTTEAKRKWAEQWGVPTVFIDESGKETPFTSPTAALRFFKLPFSGTICDAEGKECSALSLAEIFRIRGYTVTDADGTEPKKASQGGKAFIIKKAVKG